MFRSHVVPGQEPAAGCLVDQTTSLGRGAVPTDELCVARAGAPIASSAVPLSALPLALPFGTGPLDAPPAAPTPVAEPPSDVLRLVEAPADKVQPDAPRLGARPVAQAPVAEASVVESPVLSSPVLSSPVHEAPAHKSPVHEAPVAQALVSNAPVAQTPAHKVPLAGPVSKAPVFPAPVAEAPVPKAPVSQAMVSKSPVAAAPAQSPTAPRSVPAGLPPGLAFSALGLQDEELPARLVDDAPARVDAPAVDKPPKHKAATEQVPVVRSTSSAPRHAAPQDEPLPPPRQRPGLVWMAVTVLGVVLVTVLGAVVSARVSAVALAVLVAGCAAARALARPPALTVRTRRTDVLVLGLLAVALAVVATRLPPF